MSRKLPGPFTLLVFFSAFAAFLAIAGWFRQFSLIYGIHVKSITVIITLMLLVLSLGGWISGRIADRVKDPLIVFIVLSGVAAIIIFLHAPLLHLIASGFRNTFLVPLLVFIIPLAAISGGVPLTARYFIRSLNYAGIYMSRILFAISGAVILSVILSVLILIPLFGIHSLFVTSGVSLSIAVCIALLHRFKKKVESNQMLLTQKKGKIRYMKFRKKRIVLETGIKLTRAMLYGSVFQSFSFASMIIIYLRVLIRYNHLNPVFFYACIFGVVFAGVAIGSLLYGIIADKPANKYLTLAILQIVAGIATLLSFAVQQFLSPDLFAGIHESNSFADLIFRHILIFSLLAFIPSVIYGMSLPLAGRLYPKRLQQIGQTFGQLSSLILLSILCGIFITPMFLIPLIGTHSSFIFLSMLIVFSGAYLIVRDSRLIRAFRLTFAFSSIILFILIIVVLRMLNAGQINRVAGGIYEGNTSAVRYKINADSTGSAYINGDYYFGTDKESIREQIFSVCISLAVHPHIDKAFFIGFNTGITASVFEKFGLSEIQIAEISPELIRMASSSFSDENDDILTESSVHVRVADPRVQLDNPDGSFDLIYSGAEQILLYPSRYTTDFFKICLGKLSGEGIYCQVLPYNRMDSLALISILSSCYDVFGNLSTWYLSEGRIMIIGSKEKVFPEYCNLYDVINRLRNPWLDRLAIQTPDDILSHFLFSGNPFAGIELPPNTDDHPGLQFRLAEFEKEDIQPLYFTRFAERPVPISLSDSCDADENEIRTRVTELNRLLLQKLSLSGYEEIHEDSSAWNGQPSQKYP